MNAGPSTRVACAGPATPGVRRGALGPVRSGIRGRFLLLALSLLGPTQAWAQVTPPPAPTTGEIVEYYATDALGSVRVVFTAAGAEVARADYLPFGERFHTTGPLPSQQFTGQQRDPEAQLDHFNARSYQTTTGRFTGMDPVYPWQQSNSEPKRLGAATAGGLERVPDANSQTVNPTGGGLLDAQMWNRYAYVTNRPLRFTDPTGAQVKDADRKKQPFSQDPCEATNDPECYGFHAPYWGPTVIRIPSSQLDVIGANQAMTRGIGLGATIGTAAATMLQLSGWVYPYASVASQFIQQHLSAAKIAEHAWKHVMESPQMQAFFRTETMFHQAIFNTMRNPDLYRPATATGTQAFYSRTYNMMVIYNPAHVTRGTALRISEKGFWNYPIK